MNFVESRRRGRCNRIILNLKQSVLDITAIGPREAITRKGERAGAGVRVGRNRPLGHDARADW